MILKNFVKVSPEQAHSKPHDFDFSKDRESDSAVALGTDILLGIQSMFNALNGAVNPEQPEVDLTFGQVVKFLKDTPGQIEITEDGNINISIPANLTLSGGQA